MLWFIILACGDVEPVIEDSAVAEPSSVDPTVEEEEEDYFEPALFTMFGSFGVEGGDIRSFWVDENEILPNIQLAFYNSDMSQSCMVFVFWESKTVVLEDWIFEDETDSEQPVQMFQKGLC